MTRAGISRAGQGGRSGRGLRRGCRGWRRERSSGREDSCMIVGEIQGCVYDVCVWHCVRACVCVCSDMKQLSLCDCSECSLRTHNIITCT